MAKLRTKKTSKKIDKFGPGAAVAVEVPLGDGSVSMLTGRIVSIDEKVIVLASAALVKDTGRRTQFFAGIFDSNCEIEVYADDVQIPRVGGFLYAWPHALPTVQR
jgi:hypothetical protein